MDRQPVKQSRNIPITFLRNRYFTILITLSLIVIVIWQVARITKANSVEELRRIGDLRVDFYASSLRDTLEKYRHLPYVLARDSRIHNLLRNETTSLRVSSHLEDFAHASGALIFVQDKGGTTVAASNWRTDKTLLGHNFSFRPYFTEAKAGKTGGYYAVGFLTHKPGFFLSYPVMHMGKFQGVVVVKVDLEPMQDTWKRGGEAVIVSDAYGVIFLTSNLEWRYTSIRPLPLQTKNELQNEQYLNLPLPSLTMHRENIGENNILELEGKKYLEQSLQLPEYGWRIHYLTDLHVVEDNVTLAMTVSVILASLFCLALLYLQERRQKLISLEEARKSFAIQEVNERLRQEIAKHKETEENLRKTQNELVQAGKLAALGRMSAAIAHELNQPVTAIRTFVASCRILVKREKPEEVLENLDFISRLTERMGKITAQLKTFARKSKGREEIIDLTEVVDKVLVFMMPQISAANATLQKDVSADCSVLVSGDSLQLEQVLSNLLHNGLDALKMSKEKVISVQIQADKKHATIIFADSGCGIPENILDSLFDPFFTTKDIGEGLGLGLSISYGIIQEMGGSIQAANRNEGGAQFTITIPLAKTA